MRFVKRFGLFILVLVALLAFLTLFTVREGQRGMLLRLGKIIQNPLTGKAIVLNPGLHAKIPIINQVKRFDVRLQTLSVESSRILTEEQKYVLVDYYAKWRIADLPLYYKRTGGFALQAQTLLTQQINDLLRAAFGKRSITEVVSGERTDIMKIVKELANKSASRLGIEVADVRVKRIDLPKEVSESVFARMSADRERVATKHRSDGKKMAEKLRAQADASVTVLLAQAHAKAATIRALGKAKAANIYSTAYSVDPKFYAFYRSLDAYRHTFNNKNDIIVLKPDTQFFSYFANALGDRNKTKGVLNATHSKNTH